MRKFDREQGDLEHLEQSLAVALEQSSVRLEEWLQSHEPAPESGLEKQEQLHRLAEALKRLPDEQRNAVELRHLQGLSVPAISQLLEKSVPAVAGLLRRGLKTLREQMEEAS